LNSYELFIGLRYTRSRQRTRFISVISLISVVGIALGMTVLVTVLSVMNGFQRELRTRILGVAAHVEISGSEGTLTDSARVAKQALDYPGVIGAAPYVSAQGMLSFGGNVRGTTVRGIVPASEASVAELGKRMVVGTMEALAPGEFGIVLGAELARSLRARLGDRVTLISPQGLVTPAGIVPRLKQFRLVGVFEIGMFEFDGGLALIHLADAQRLYRLEDKVSGVRLKLADLFESRAVAQKLGGQLGGGLKLTDWTKTHATFFRAVQIEKNMMFIILTLIVAVAAFNIVSTLVMVVTDKEPDIAILRTLGASPGSIMRIFVVQGALIGVVGTLLGVIGGILLAYNVDTVVPFLERLIGLRFLSPDVYYISELPSDPRRADIIAIGLVSLILSFLATLYPSYRASKVRPAEALRYE
jgi:lipoprotein-releasing system permease protein